jgi:hypothetical protein
VPVGQSVLSSHRRQGFITREVTNYLNLTGAIALMPLAFDVAVSTHRSARRWFAWVIMAVAQGVLFWLHGQLDELLDPEHGSLLDLAAFRTGHRWYLWVSTIQWAAAVVYTLLTLAAWAGHDKAGLAAEPQAVDDRILG